MEEGTGRAGSVDEEGIAGEVDARGKSGTAEDEAEGEVAEGLPAGGGKSEPEREGDVSSW